MILARLAPFVAVIALVPLADSGYLTNIMIIVALHALPALGLALLMGFTGQISLGHAAFYGLGAYGSALLTLKLGVNPWLSIALASVAVGVVALLLGWAIFRLRGHHLALATLGMGIIVAVGFVELRDLTGGPTGLAGIPSLSLFGIQFYSDQTFFYLVWIVCAALFLAAHNLVSSPIGLAMRGVDDSERASASVGVDVDGLKREILALSAGLAAIAGGLYAHYIGFISPQPFSVPFSIKLLVMVAIGGFRSVTGVLFGVAFVTIVAEPLQQLGYYDVVVFGLLLVVIMILCPNGLFQGLWDLRGAIAARLRPQPR